MRWANFLSQYHIHIAHKAGKKNKVADALSRSLRVNVISIAYNHDSTRESVVSIQGLKIYVITQIHTKVNI